MVAADEHSPEKIVMGKYMVKKKRHEQILEIDLLILEEYFRYLERAKWHNRVRRG